MTDAGLLAAAKIIANAILSLGIGIGAAIICSACIYALSTR